MNNLIYRLVVAINDDEMLNQVSRIVDRIPSLDVVACIRKGEDAYRIIRRTKPDIVFLEGIMPGMDCLTLVDGLEKVMKDDLPYFFIGCYIMPEMLKMISGHDHVIMVNQFPMYDSVLAKQIERGIRFYSDIDYVKQMRFGDIGIDVVRESDAFYGEEYELRDYRRVRRVVSQEMKLMGVNSKYKGYMYMECALSTELAYGTLSRGGAMKLYEHVGEQMGTSKHSTEKAIRTVIKDTWVNGNKKYFKDLWGYRNVTRDNIPNNKEFISIVVNSIERDYIL